jgi:hypothetical protein
MSTPVMIVMTVIIWAAPAGTRLDNSRINQDEAAQCSLASAKGPVGCRHLAVADFHGQVRASTDG